MIIDAHRHILSLAIDPQFTVDYGREGSLCIYRSMVGFLPIACLPRRNGRPAGSPGAGGR